MMIELEKKFLDVTCFWEKEMTKEDSRVFQNQLKDEDITEYQGQHRAKSHGQGAEKEDDTFHKKDKIIEKLRGCLRRQSHLPDDVINILSADLDEKQK